MGSNKIGKACPARIEVSFAENKGEETVNVQFYKTHYGHSAEIGRIHLDKESRIEIAGNMDVMFCNQLYDKYIFFR